MTIPTFQKHDRVAFRESPEVEGKIVEWWKRGFYKVAWDSGVTYQGKTYGIPILSAPQTLMYRKDMLQSAGPLKPKGGPSRRRPPLDHGTRQAIRRSACGRSDGNRRNSCAPR